MNRQIALLAALCIFVTASAAQTDGDTSAAPTVWSGLYTASQASRGERLIADHCVQCHGATLRGAPGVLALVGSEFKANWGGKMLGELLEVMRTTMPPGQAGTLPDQAYADILANLLQANGYPAGESKELPADPEALKQALISERKP